MYSSFPASKTDFVRVFTTLLYILTSYKGNKIFCCLKAIYSRQRKEYECWIFLSTGKVLRTYCESLILKNVKACKYFMMPWYHITYFACGTNTLYLYDHNLFQHLYNIFENSKFSYFSKPQFISNCSVGKKCQDFSKPDWYSS